MGKDSDRIAGNIACLNTAHTPAALVSTAGYHCEVWRTAGAIVHEKTKRAVDVVVKRYRKQCRLQEAIVFGREYRLIKKALRDIVPTAMFVPTAIDGQRSIIVIAQAIVPWFNIANPANEEEAVPLLRRLIRAKLQLDTFVAAANRWYEEGGKVIDLFGVDNLVLDTNRNIRYVDSFGVFFYEDILYAIGDADFVLAEKIKVSLQRRDYLEYLLRESRMKRVAGPASASP